MSPLRATETRRRMALEAAKADEAREDENKKPEPFNIDDPQNISSFLAAMNFSVTSPQIEPARNTSPKNNPAVQASMPADVVGGLSVST